MRSDNTQLDLYRDDPRRIAAAHRIAAETERFNPYFPESERERRAAHHIAEAERLEATAS